VETATEAKHKRDKKKAASVLHELISAKSFRFCPACFKLALRFPPVKGGSRGKQGPVWSSLVGFSVIVKLLLALTKN